MAVIWTRHSLADQVIESLSPAGGTPKTWITTDGNTYYLAGWATGFGLLVWYDEGNGGPSVENYGLPLGSLAQPGDKLTVLATAPLFQPPALATGPSSELAVVASGGPTGRWRGEKFVWFGKTVETCSPTSEDCSAVDDQPSLVTLNPAISPVNGSLAFVEAPQSTEGIVPYSEVQPRRRSAIGMPPIRCGSCRRGSATPTEINGADGASDPLWSRSGMGLLFVKNQAVWLMDNTGPSPSRSLRRSTLPLARPARPVRVCELARSVRMVGVGVSRVGQPARAVSEPSLLSISGVPLFLESPEMPMSSADHPVSRTLRLSRSQPC